MSALKTVSSSNYGATNSNQPQAVAPKSYCELFKAKVSKYDYAAATWTAISCCMVIINPILGVISAAIGALVFLIVCALWALNDYNKQG